MEPLRTRSAGSKSPLLFGRFLAPKMRFRSDQENTPPVHPNIQIDRPPSPLAPKKPSEAAVARAAAVPECARSNSGVSAADPAADPSDSSVKVVVRIRPGNRHERGDERIVRKVSSDSVAVGDRTFKFDSILGSESTQEDVFNLVGVPLVKNSLAGFNTSIVSYGQTGSGKTYTMWGPPSAMVDSHSISSYQGIVPRIFQMLFSEINKKQEGTEEKQTNYQCRCSFLEIYNNQVNDLLDPTQRNLQIRDDAKNGFHVENLTDEYVTATEDVTQLLVKGLSNRKVGTTSTNSKSSRSHIIFTCVIESWCKGSSSKCFGSSKTSRINLVDLAGADTDKLDDSSRYCVKEGRHVKKSLSKLGKLVNNLSEVTQSGKEQKSPYMDSPLTHLLQETLGGNAKVTFICAVFPNDRHKSGTMSTLRFGERVVHIQNKAVINEITEDDVNGLSDQIRQLKDELIRAKSYGGSSVGSTGEYFKGRNGRDCLNLLRVSLNRSLILPHIDNDSEEEIDIHEEDMKELCVQLSTLDSSYEDNLEHISKIENEDISENENPPSDESAEISASNIMESYLGEHNNASPFEEEKMVLEVHAEISVPEAASNGSDILVFPNAESDHQIKNSFSKSSLSIMSPMQSPHDPTLCESPKISNRLRKSIISLSGCLDGETNVSDSPKCFAKSNSIRSSLQSSKVCPTESLAASLHRGLQIIDYHQQNPAIKKSFVGLSLEHLAAFSRPRLDKVNASVQTLSDGVAASPFLCSSCRKVETSKVDLGANSEMQIVPVNEAGTPEALKKQVQKDDDMISAVIKREGELEALCAEQTATIERLNHLVQQNGCEQNSSIKENNIPQILCLARSTSRISDMELKSGHGMSVADGHLLLQHNEENHPDNKTYFDMGEREALLGEIQTLREQLKSYTDVSTDDSPLEQIRNGGVGSTEKRDQIEKERQKWTESESQWISLTEELRLDLESNRRVSERKDKELNMEKELTAELDDALHRAMVGHARMVEHYAELQEKHESLLWSHKKVMEGIAEVKKAAAKAGGKRAGSAFVSALAAELSTLRVEREKERAYLKEQNKGLRTQLRDTAEAVHAAGELLVRLREAEEAVSVTEEKYGRAQQEIEKLKRQIDKMKKKHKMEMVTMKHYLAESRLPEEALEPFYLNDPGNAEDTAGRSPAPEDEQSWRSAFSPSYH